MDDLNLDLAAIAAATGMQPDVPERGGSPPLHERGVRLGWLIGFLKEVDAQRRLIVDRHESQRRASIHFDSVPWPEALPPEATGDLDGEIVAFDVVRPMTRCAQGPLYARVPEEHRGLPDLFVSHAWANPLIGGSAFTSLYALSGPYRSHGPATFVWLDLVCYNQHRPEAIADDMRTVIRHIGRVALPLINPVPFTRLWCLWELLCAFTTKAEIEVWEANGSVYDLGFLARTFEETFVSVTHARTRLAADRQQILDAMVEAFGSLEAADRYVRRLVLDQLSKDSDKPWNRPG